jgi:peptidoglycan/xylan/chitin deacetylase (PgdA/CDA1 family)
MKRWSRLIVATCFSSAIVIFAPVNASSQAKPDRQVAITVDDLPSNVQSLSAAQIVAMNTKLVGALRDQKVPAVGFVNEKQLYHFGEMDERIKALQVWVDNGLELGNHTFSHTSLNQGGLKAWEEDIVRGETVTSMLLASHKMKLRYFRHPYLDVGRDVETRRKAEEFLVDRGYRIAPITLDSWDWMYGRVYQDAIDHKDTDLQQKLVQSFLSYSDEVFAYEEQFSVKFLGYEPKQILLLHGTQLEADHIGDLLRLMRKRGYRFITLADALSDQAYSLPNTFVGEEGNGWIEQWAITQGKIPQGGPEFPQWVIERSKTVQASQP